MCLFAKSEPKAAEVSVTCWKFVEVIEGLKGERITITPYLFTPIDESELKGDISFKAKGVHCIEQNERHADEKCISSGYIHTYAGLDMDVFESEMEYLAHDVGGRDAYIGASAESIGCRRSPKVLAIQLWRCEIPAGTRYVEGEVEANDRKGYASDEIVFKEMTLEIGTDIAGSKHEDERYEKYGELVKRIKN